ncbi:MAG: HAMP domain-containing sensor histidine kinase, partial [Cyclobacteriaceae bacterium]
MAEIQNNIEAQERTEKTARLLIHEIMNPVSSMSLSVETLQLNGAGSEKLEILEQSLDKLIQFVKEYAEAVRKPSIEKKEMLLKKTLDVCVAESARNSEMRNISINLEEVDKNLRIQGDKRMLQEAFLHLLLNAMEACGFDGGNIKLTSGKDGEFAYVRIKDSGSGISEEDLPFILEPLF